MLRPPLLPVGLGYLKFGPMWRPAGEPADRGVLARMLSALVEEYCRRRGHMLTVLPRPSPDFNEAEEQALREAGFRPREGQVDPLRYLVDVSRDPKDQMASLGQKWRYNLRKALQNGLEVSLADPAEGIGEFAQMHREMVARKGIADRDAVEARLNAMLSDLPSALRPTIAFVRKEGRALAGAVVGRTGDVPVYLFGASRDEALDLNAGYALQWWIVNWLREQGERWYDLGGGAMEPRLEQFKRGLVGKAGRIHRMLPEHDHWAGVPGRLAGELVYRVRDAQRLIRAALGRP
jgi:CelD/BcsL family acetyltransferase involved in cellulose biosynthesis